MRVLFLPTDKVDRNGLTARLDPTFTFGKQDGLANSFSKETES
jgi:hypothetical protein